jgi:hypothetical protein
MQQRKIVECCEIFFCADFKLSDRYSFIVREHRRLGQCNTYPRCFFFVRVIFVQGHAILLDVSEETTYPRCDRERVEWTRAAKK